jgi:Calcineurin-like phosphoesterase
MRIAVLQLSDIHFQLHRKFALTRAGKIASAVCGAQHSWESLIVLLTGDIANAGLKNEYAIAGELVEAVTKAIGGLRPACAVSWFAIPGNHDCDYTGTENAVRELLLDGLLQQASATLQGAPLKHLLQPQDNFEAFRASLNPEYAPSNDAERVAMSVNLELGGYPVRLNLLNTAVACRRRGPHETDQGKLILPINLIPSQLSGTDSYAISLLHHPLNWLESNNSVEVRRKLSSSSDLILTGHQHEEDAAASDWISRDKNLWVSATALQDAVGTSSGFNLIEVDLESLSESVTQYEWVGDIFQAKSSRTWKKDLAARNSRRSIPMDGRWLQSLEDPGTGFTHPTKKVLTLNDIYVQPKLKELLGSADASAAYSDGNGEVEFFSAISGSALNIIVGEARSGKTTLIRKTAKYLYSSDQGVSPLVLRGGSLDKTHLDAIRLWRLIRREFDTQYEQKSYIQFEQLSPERRVLIIDDWQNAQLNDAGRAELLSLLSQAFSRIVLFADETVKMEDIEVYTRPFVERNSFSARKISAFGHLLRARLIRKWLTIGREKTLSSQDLQAEVRQAEATLNTVLGKSLLPSYPFFLLSLMQVAQNIAASQHANGSYGYLYESLITMALASVSQEATEVDVYYTILGRIAWNFRANIGRSCPIIQMNRIILHYGDEYKALVEPAKIINLLLKANILTVQDGEYRFKYKYIGYYFTARYIADNLKNPGTAAEARTEMLTFADHITRSESANIVIFLIYLTRDSEMIERLLFQAKTLFVSVPVFDADNSVAFLAPVVRQVFRDSRPKVIGTPEQNLDEERENIDLDASEEEDIDDEGEDDPTGPDGDFSRAIKLMDILGQIVRNFPGSMPGDRKLEITGEVYKLGLRLISVAISAFETDEKEFRSFLAMAIQSELEPGSRELDSATLQKRVDRLVVVFAEMVAFNFIKAITGAVGLKQLKPIYDEVTQHLTQSPALRLVDLSIGLDHGTTFPKDKILQLNTDFAGKWFARILLRELVGYHFMMFHVERNLAKSIGEKIGIDMTDREIVAQLASKPRSTEDRSN